MPLGLMTGMDYEETEAVLAPGARLLLYSDGVTEAHDPGREMFGGGRLSDLMAASGSQDVESVSARSIGAVHDFTGAGGGAGGRHHPGRDPARRSGAAPTAFSIRSEAGNEREAIRLARAGAGRRRARRRTGSSG